MWLIIIIIIIIIIIHTFLYCHKVVTSEMVYHEIISQFNWKFIVKGNMSKRDIQNCPGSLQ